MALRIEKPNLLVVEGKDEEFFFGAFLKHLKLKEVQPMGIGGKTKIRQNLGALKRTPNFAKVAALGIVRDANDDPRAAFQSLHDALEHAGLAAPKRPLVSAGDKPRVTVMILPGEGQPGMLEDLCLRSVKGDAAMTCVDGHFHCLEEKQKELTLPRNRSKANVQVFLSSREEAGKRLGEAAQAGYWPFDDEAFGEVKKFLQQFCI